MGKFLLRVDDVGWLPDKNKDVELEYFEKWRKAMRLAGYPVYYGVIPSLLGNTELIWLNRNLIGKEELAVHGSTHQRGEKVSTGTMRNHSEKLGMYRKCRSYIPPFNDYSDVEVVSWGEASPYGFFFGGFNNEHHRKGNLPVNGEGCYHLPAYRPLYDHTHRLLVNIPRFTSLECPLVVTLHCTWGHNEFEVLPRLGETLKPHLVSLDFVKEWMENSKLNLNQLTAPHYLAYKSITDHLGGQLGLRVLDFGSRYSALPSLMALRGWQVTAVDRDERIHQYQKEVRARYGNPHLVTHRITDVSRIQGEYDLITCCWSLQHNLPRLNIKQIVQQLSSRLLHGGRLMIVGSYNHSGEIEQLNRADPQIILDRNGYEELIIGPSEMKVLTNHHFYYQHNTNIGKYRCAAEDANAVFYELVKR